MAFHNASLDESSDEPAPLADINVTPFIDVMLVLLIIFMVTAPMLTAGMKVELPKAGSARPLEPKRPVLVTVGPAGEIQVGDHTVGKDDLLAAVRVALAGEDRPIQLRGDSATAYGNVVAVLDALTVAGLPKVVLAFERAPARGKPLGK